MTPGSGEHARLFEITDEEVGAAAAADGGGGELEPSPGDVAFANEVAAAVEAADDGRRRAPPQRHLDRCLRRPSRRAGRRPHPAAARRRRAPRRTAPDHCRCRLGQDPRAHPAHRASPRHGRRAAVGHPRHHLHQQGGGRDAHAGGRAGGATRREDVGLDLPLGLPAHSAHERRPAGLPLRLHGLRRHRLAPAHRDDHRRARLRPEAAAVAGGAGRHQPGQVRAGGLRDVPGGRPQRAGPVPQAHRRHLRAVPGPFVGSQRPRLRRPAHGDGQPAAGLRRRARLVSGAFPAHPRRRVPGHEPRPERDRQAAG